MNQPRTRFNYLQALRFAAALSVVVFHSGHYVNFNGQRPEAFLLIFNDPALSYSVYLFFAISGFVLTPVLERTFITEFLLYRFLRIYPAFWGAVLLLVGARFVLFREQTVLDWRSLSLLPFGVLSYPLGIEWTLIYEIFFYLVLAALSLLRSRLLFNLALLSWTTLIFVSYLTVDASLTQILPTWRVIPFSLMNLSFIAGIVAYQVYPFVIRYRWLLLPEALATLYLVRMSTNPLLVFSGLALGCGSLVAFAAAQSTMRDLPTQAFLVKLGNYSYGIYLLHVPVMTMLIKLPLTAHIPTWVLFALCILLALLIGSSFGWVELRLYQAIKQFVSVRKRA